MNALELKQKTTKELLNIAEEHGLKHVSRQKKACLLYTSPSPRDMRRSRMPSSA